MPIVFVIGVDPMQAYIADTYDAATADERNAVGFVMNIYRRRLASSFLALRKTLGKRRQGIDGLLSEIDETRFGEDMADLVEAGEEIDADTISEEERKALASIPRPRLSGTSGAPAELLFASEDPE